MVLIGMPDAATRMGLNSGRVALQALKRKVPEKIVKINDRASAIDEADLVAYLEVHGIARGPGRPKKQIEPLVADGDPEQSRDTAGSIRFTGTFTGPSIQAIREAIDEALRDFEAGGAGNGGGDYYTAGDKARVNFDYDIDRVAWDDWQIGYGPRIARTKRQRSPGRRKKAAPETEGGVP